MAYRDELEAAHHRIRQLEQELGEARDELARRAAPRDAESWAGGPIRLAHERIIPRELREPELKALRAAMRHRFGNTRRSSAHGGTIGWRTRPRDGRIISLRVTVRDGRTYLRLEEQLGPIVGAIFGGVGGGVGMGGLGVVLGLSAIAGLGPVAALLAVGWLGGSLAIARATYQNIAERRSRELERLMEELEEIGMSREAPPQVRVGEPDELEIAEAATADAAAKAGARR